MPIIACPICGRESGVTHGDQLFEKQICDECLAIEEEEKGEINGPSCS